MENLEKQIEEAVDLLVEDEYGFLEYIRKNNLKESFVDFAKSETIKEYWQQGMYSKEVLKLAWSAGYNKAVSSINEDRYDEEDNSPTFEQWFNNLNNK